MTIILRAPAKFMYLTHKKEKESLPFCIEPIKHLTSLDKFTTFQMQANRRTGSESLWTLKQTIEKLKIFLPIQSILYQKKNPLQ